MKSSRLAAFLLFVVCALGIAQADVIVAPLPTVAYTLMRSTTNVKAGWIYNGQSMPATYPTAVACQTAGGQHAEYMKSGANYRCRSDLVFVVTYKVPADPPKPTDPLLFKQTVQCTAPLVGSFVQTRDYTLVTTATGKVWNPTPWTPLVAPAGACTTPVSSLLPYIDDSKIPVAAVGFSVPRIQKAPGPFDSNTPGQPDGPQAPNPADIGQFRLGCTFGFMAYLDPVVYPGQAKAGHLHTFVGNVGVTANSTAATIPKTGNSTCSGGTLNRSAYWFPTMIDTTNGTPIAPSGFLVYYKTGYDGVKPADVKAVPTGLVMISGNAAGNSEATAQSGRFACVGGINGAGWQKSIPSACYQDNQMIFEVSFPQCWDGVNLDSPNHKSHLAEATGSGCPKTHPVGLPAITYEIYYDLAKINLANLKNWRLSSDNYAATIPGGYGAHGDYVFGWDETTMGKFIKNCDNPSIDCHTNLLGDGTWLY